jgi:hypothetical protein
MALTNDGVLEYRSNGVLGFNALLLHSITPRPTQGSFSAAPRRV